MQVLIHDVERSSRHRQSEHGGHHGDSGPAGGSVLKEPANDAPAGPDDQQDGDRLPEQFRPGQRNPSQPHKVRHPRVEYAGAHLQLEESRVVREESRIQIRLDGGQVDAVVFDAGVVPHDAEAKHRERQDQQKITIGGMMHALLTLLSNLNISLPSGTSACSQQTIIRIVVDDSSICCQRR